MGKKQRKKRNKLGPRRKRMRRPARLASARVWLPTYGGRNVVRGYARWYGVDLCCVIAELRLLGVKVSEDYAAQVERSIEQRALARARRRAVAAAERHVGRLEEWGEDLAYDVDSFEGWDDEHPVVDPDAWPGEAAELRGEDEELPIEYAFLRDVFALDLKVIETTIEIERIERIEEIEQFGEIAQIAQIAQFAQFGEIAEDPPESALPAAERDGPRPVRVRIVLEEDPDVLAARAFGLIYVLGVLSYASAGPRAGAGEGGGAGDDGGADDDGGPNEWTVDDLLRRLAFDRGRLSFHADRVRGRYMGTTIEIEPDGKITVETVGRGRAAKRWISKLQGTRMTTPDPEGAPPDLCPF